VDSEHWNRRYASAELVWTAEPNRFLVAEVGTLPAGSALDLGADVGHEATNIGYGGPQDPDVPYSADDVRNDLTAFSIERRLPERVRRTVETPNGQRKAIDALVRARRMMGR